MKAFDKNLTLSRPCFSCFRINIYYGLLAYQAEFAVVVAYIVYIVLLIVGLGVYHYRWSREGQTVRGDSRILVKNFLMEENEEGEKGDQSKQPLLSLVSQVKSREKGYVLRTSILMLLLHFLTIAQDHLGHCEHSCEQWCKYSRMVKRSRKV